jgi:hypothetical protein
VVREVSLEAAAGHEVPMRLPSAAGRYILRVEDERGGWWNEGITVE